MQSRRTFVKGLGALAGGALVLGWHPGRRAWVTEANAEEPFDELPDLDGTVHTDPDVIERFTEDFGRVRFRAPVAVLKPGSVDDVVAIVRFARRRGIQVAMNGQSGTGDLRESHSSFGQAQVEGGIVIDVKPLATIHGIDPQRRLADVGPGVRWSELLDAAEAFGLAPAVMTDYLHLSVGGTLSVGGVGGHSPRLGVQADQVDELEVVTGAGERLVCSPSQHRSLFEAVLAGCGQVALIVRAKVRLAPARTHALIFHLFYRDAETYVRDQTLLLDDGRFDYQEGHVVPRQEGSGWGFMIEAAAYFDAPDAPDTGELLEGLSDDRPSAEIFPVTYREWQFRVDPLMTVLKAQSLWAAPHPWLSMWIPGSQAASYIRTFTERLTPEDLGAGLALVYPIDTRAVKRPLFRLPKERVAFFLSLLRFPPDDPDIVASMLADNRRIHDEIVARGGTRYVISSVPNTTLGEWRRHFRPAWGFLVRTKRRHDPDNVLTPGFGMFRE